MTTTMFSDLIGIAYEQLRCYDLVREVYHRIGIELPEFSDVTGISLVKKLIIEQKKLTTELKKPEPFCIVFIARSVIEPHVGVVLQDCKQFIHSCYTGVTVSKLYLWQNQIKGYYKWKLE